MTQVGTWARHWSRDRMGSNMALEARRHHQREDSIFPHNIVKELEEQHFPVYYSTMIDRAR